MSSFSKILRLNTIKRVMPLVVIFMMTTLVAYCLYGLREYTVYNLENVSLAETCLAEGKTLVTVTAPRLFPLGYDAYTEDGRVGEYFYYMDYNSIRIFLLKEGTSYKNIEGKELSVKLMTDSGLMDLIRKDYSDELGLSEQSMDGYIRPVIMDEYSFPGKRIMMIKIFLLVSAGILVVIILYLLISLINTSISPGAASLRRYGGKKDMIRELSIELRDRLLYSASGIYVTENYLITSAAFWVRVLRLDDVKYLSKHVEAVRGISGKRNIYRLTASNDEGLYFEHDFKSEEVIDKAIFYIRREDISEEDNQEGNIYDNNIYENDISENDISENDILNNYKSDGSISSGNDDIRDGSNDESSANNNDDEGSERTNIIDDNMIISSEELESILQEIRENRDINKINSP